ncbi:uncharacterized protein [Palaemon carinicauda]|uniref:uncharacterized protein n=1 Tax=Palaemon carinicauda TaxID=392227 RepID=UPI0035B58E3A
MAVGGRHQGTFAYVLGSSKMSGAIILSVALLVGGINTPAVLAVINNILYHSVGEVTEGISDTFALYDGVPKIRCLAICSEKECPIVAWGAGSRGSGHCRVLSGAAVSTNIAITLSTTEGTLTVYIPISSTLTFVQKPYALLLHIAGSYSWSQMRINCRNKGIGLYTPMSSSIIQDLFGTYGEFWTGTRDTDVEGTFRSEDGTTFDVPGSLWCSSQPNNYGTGGQDCVAAESNTCYNDQYCSSNYAGLCIVGI